MFPFIFILELLLLKIIALDHKERQQEGLQRCNFL